METSIMPIKKKRLLVLTPRFPYPVIGGDRLRIYYICKELAKNFDLTLLSLCDQKSELNLPVNDHVFKDIHRVYLPKWRSYLNSLIALPTKTPLQLAYYKSHKFKKAIDKLLPSHDGVLSHLIRTGQYIESNPYNKPRFLEMTDAISLNYKRVQELKEKKKVKQWIYNLEASRLERYEKTCIHNYDTVTLVSDIDRQHLTKHPTPNINIISNGADFSLLTYIGATPKSRLIVFIGNIISVQNQDACQYFIDSILPLLNKKENFTFRIIGNIHPNVRSHFENYSNVEVTGKVNSVSDAAQGALCGVCPVRIGAGIQNKILEYMSIGLPAITTTMGKEGINATPDKEVLIRDTPEAFSNAIHNLQTQPDLLKQIAAAGNAYVQQNHQWDHILESYTNNIRYHLNKSKNTVPINLPTPMGRLNVELT